MITPLIGRPGIRTEKQMTHRVVSSNAFFTYLARGVAVDATRTRFSLGTASDDPLILPPGTLMGKITTGGLYANSVIGVTAGALTSSGTSITISAPAAVELVRRIGSTGNLTLTGPPTANGTARSLTVAYSGVNTTTGVVTITPTGVNAVITLGFTGSPTGTFRLRIADLNGVIRTTGPITYNATPATLVSNINTALDATFGAGLIVASGSAVTAIAITFSGAGYAALPQSLVVESDGLTAGLFTVTNTTTGVDGRFATGSLVGPTDGSQVPLTMIPDGYGLYLGDGSQPVDWPLVPIEASLVFNQLLPSPTDLGLRAWIRNSLSTTSGGKFTFTDTF